MSDQYSLENTAKNNQKQKERYEAAVSRFLEECNDIDDNTWYQTTEPSWWLEMMDTARAVLLIQQGEKV